YYKDNREKKSLICDDCDDDYNCCLNLWWGKPLCCCVCCYANCQTNFYRIGYSMPDCYRIVLSWFRYIYNDYAAGNTANAELDSNYVFGYDCYSSSDRSTCS